MSAASTDFDAAMMRRAIRLAMNGRGTVEPNPMVGCVIVKDGRVIGEGYHQQFGGPHAEPNALAACSESPEGATAYVTLEPCCHTNKKTPPCAPRLIGAKIARVVIGCLDPNSQVNGKSVEKLRAAGIVVEPGVLESEAKQLIAPFLARVREGRPYATLKWAQTADGKIAGPGGKRMQISNPASRRAIHRLRAACDVILVGIGTVLADDPLLTVRDAEIRRPLLRAVLDTHLRIPVDSQLVQTTDRSNPVRVFCSEATASDKTRRAKLAELNARFVEVYPLPQNADGTLSFSHLLRTLGSGIAHVLVEPGPILARRFVECGLVDRLWVTRSPKRIDDDTAPAAIAVSGQYVATGQADLDGDVLTEYLNPASRVYFGAFPSADIVLARV